MFADSNGSGVFERGADGVASERRFGCMRYHPAHNHWHVLDIASYELRREPSGKLFAHSRKVGFCLTDARLAFPGPGSRRRPRPTRSTRRARRLPVGVHPGDLTRMGRRLRARPPRPAARHHRPPRGHYCLITRADPTGVLDELDEDNNVRRVHLALRPSKLVVRKLAGPCRI